MPRPVVKKQITKAHLAEHETNGWEFLGEKDGICTVRKRLKKWERFEMGVREFLRRNLFEDTIEPADFFDRRLGYQIDASGGLEGHFFIIDCTTRSEPGAKSLSYKTKDFHNKIPDLEKTIRKVHREKYHTLHFVILAEDIEITERDERYAEDRGIRVISADKYFEWLDAEKANIPTLRYQVLEFLAGEKIPIPGTSPDGIRFPAMRYPLAPGRNESLVCFSAPPEILHKVCFVYRLAYKDPRGYQRPLIRKKLREINQFLAQRHNGFPNSLLIAFDEAPDRHVVFEPLGEQHQMDTQVELGHVILPPYFGIAEVIDGQHRLFGYTDFSKGGTYIQQLIQRRQDDRLLVVAYPDPTQSERPNLFLTINSNQTRISVRQIWALMAKSRPDTHMGYVARIVLSLNQDGPLAGKIEIPGVTPRRRKYPINIANLGKGIMDRHLFDKEKNFDWNLFPGSRAIRTYPAEIDSGAIRDLNAFLRAWRAAYRPDWERSDGFMLSNNGINVGLRVFAEAVKFIRYSSRSKRVAEAKLNQLFRPSAQKVVDREGPLVLLGNTSAEYGREKAAADIMKEIRKRHSGFAAQYLRARERKKSAV